MYTLNDIQIFVATYNRAELLKITLTNLLKQTVGQPSIIVLDNNSPDHTQQVVQDFSPFHIQYVKTSGFLGNFNQARKQINKPFCMIFHDDDLLHPFYLQRVLQALNTYPNVSLVTSAFTTFTRDEDTDLSGELSSEHFFFQSPVDWASYMYFMEGVSYAPAVYRTNDFLQTELEYDKFNKFNDWPFLAKLSLRGNVVFLSDLKCMFARQHAGQDSNNAANFPTIQQMVNWDNCFFTLLGRPNWRNYLYWLYGARNAHFLVGKYAAAPNSLRNKYTLDDLKSAIRQAGLPTWGLNYKFLTHNAVIHYFRKKLKTHLLKNFYELFS